MIANSEKMKMKKNIISLCPLLGSPTEFKKNQSTLFTNVFINFIPSSERRGGNMCLQDNWENNFYLFVHNDFYVQGDQPEYEKQVDNITYYKLLIDQIQSSWLSWKITKIPESFLTSLTAGHPACT